MTSLIGFFVFRTGDLVSSRTCSKLGSSCFGSGSGDVSGYSAAQDLSQIPVTSVSFLTNRSSVSKSS